MKKILLLLLSIVIFSVLNGQNIVFLSGTIKEIKKSEIQLKNLFVFDGNYKKDKIIINISKQTPFDSIFSDDSLNYFIGKKLLIYTKLSPLENSSIWDNQKCITPNENRICLLDNKSLKKYNLEKFSAKQIIDEIDTYLYYLKGIENNDFKYYSLLSFLAVNTPFFISKLALDVYISKECPSEIKNDLIRYRYGDEISLNIKYSIDTSFNFPIDYDNTDEMIEFYSELLNSGNIEYQNYAKSEINSIITELKGKIEEEKEILDKLNSDKKKQH